MTTPTSSEASRGGIAAARVGERHWERRSLFWLEPALSRGELAYAEAKAEMDAVIAGLIVVLARERQALGSRSGMVVSTLAPWMVRRMARGDCGCKCACGGAKKPGKAKGEWKGALKGE